MTTKRLIPFLACIPLWVGCVAQPFPLAFLFATPAVAEAVCGECRFGLPGHDRELATRWDGKTYFVNGVSPKSLGDAHAADGICEANQNARRTQRVRFRRASVGRPVVGLRASGAGHRRGCTIRPPGLGTPPHNRGAALRPPDYPVVAIKIIVDLPKPL